MKQLWHKHIENYLSGTATSEEKAAVDAWYQSCTTGKSLTADLIRQESQETAVRMWKFIQASIEPVNETIPST